MAAVDRAWFLRCVEEYEAKQGPASVFPIDWSTMHPCDDRDGGALFDAHYIHADLWAASGVVGENPCDWRMHVDVGSRVDGFATHLLAAERALVHVDVRPPAFTWPGLTFRQDDARTLSTFPDGSVFSLSCLHAAEHVGLGRYGDPIDPDGMWKTMASLARVLAPGGALYFAVPVGRQRLIFNAHRIASPSWVVGTFAGLGLVLESFAAVDDAGRWHPEARPEDYEVATYSCGCYLLRRPAA